LILLILISFVALYFYFRRVARLRRRDGGLGLPRDDGDGAERVPLGSERVELDDIERAEEYEMDEQGRKRRVDSRKGKGKGRAKGGERENGETVFALGDDEDR